MSEDLACQMPIVRDGLQRRGTSLNPGVKWKELLEIEAKINRPISRLFRVAYQEFDGFVYNEEDYPSWIRIWSLREIAEYNENDGRHGSLCIIGDVGLMADMIMTNLSVDGPIMLSGNDEVLADNIVQFYLSLVEGKFDPNDTSKSPENGGT